MIKLACIIYILFLPWCFAFVICCYSMLLIPNEFPYNWLISNHKTVRILCLWNIPAIRLLHSASSEQRPSIVDHAFSQLHIRRSICDALLYVVAATHRLALQSWNAVLDEVWRKAGRIGNHKENVRL